MKRNKGTQERSANLNEQDPTYGEGFHEVSAEDQALIAELVHGFDQMELSIRKPDPLHCMNWSSLSQLSSKGSANAQDWKLPCF